MEVLVKFAEHFINEHPCLSDLFTFVMMIVAVVVTLGVPFIIWLLLHEKINKGRYVFEKKNLGTQQGEQLFFLDTMKGDLFFVSGKAYYERVHMRDWKEERAKELGVKPEDVH
ncbi:MAG: hypothetical protein JST16_12240 [Bdellovibrionales bacterium]|nr:hypothetical protein [Bdellovibrionales bacterium]